MCGIQETSFRDILVGGVDCSMCTVMEVKTSLSEISGASGIFCIVVALASADADSCGIRPAIESIFVASSSPNVDIRGVRTIHGTVMWNPGNVETRDILVGGVDCLHVHSHGSERHVVERNIGRIGNILYGGCTGVPEFR
jgi:hypothetical protein